GDGEPEAVLRFLEEHRYLWREAPLVCRVRTRGMFVTRLETAACLLDRSEVEWERTLGVKT
ncbi:MAG: hypothetical protein ACKVIY_01820, partial [Acidimicrobiales bacterium]